MITHLSCFTKDFKAVENFTVKELRRYFERYVNYLEERHGS